MTIETRHGGTHQLPVGHGHQEEFGLGSPLALDVEQRVVARRRVREDRAPEGRHRIPVFVAIRSDFHSDPTDPTDPADPTRPSVPVDSRKSDCSCSPAGPIGDGTRGANALQGRPSHAGGTTRTGVVFGMIENPD